MITAWRRAIGRAAVLLTLAIGVLVAVAAPASAHPTLLFTDPAADTAVPDTPPVITLVFNEPVSAGPRTITLLDGDGREVPTGEPVAAQDRHDVSAKPAGALRPGTYRVRWRVTGSDGDQVEEEFAFAVGSSVTAAGTNGEPSISWIEAALRWLLFAGLAVAVGGVLGERFTSSARAQKPALRAPRSQVLLGTLVAVVGVSGLVILLALDIGTALWQARAGQLLLVEIAGSAVALSLVLVRSGQWRRWSAVPLLAVVVADGLRSHANQAVPGWGAAPTAVHLAAVAIWAGTLLYVVRAVLAWRAERPAVRWVLAGYLRLAGWVFAIVVVTGTVSALLLVPRSAVVTTTYGWVLLVKLAFVAVATGLALVARLAARKDRLGRVRAVTRIESFVLVAVLAVSAVLVDTPPAGSRQPGPPPPRGSVVPLGTLAGQVGVGVAASDGQVVVRLTTPRRGDYYTPQAVQGYALSGRLTNDLDFRGCGDGCFVSTVDWQRRDNVLTLHAAADGWTGGDVSLIVPWPAQPGGDALTRATQVLRTTDRFTVYESVTSDTTTAPAAPRRLDLTGPFFLAQEPYASGVAPVAARISPDRRLVRLALGYPAASTTVALTLDARGRISEETLTDDTHLIRRHFVYPG